MEMRDVSRRQDQLIFSPVTDSCKNSTPQDSCKFDSEIEMHADYFVKDHSPPLVLKAPDIMSVLLQSMLYRI